MENQSENSTFWEKPLDTFEDVVACLKWLIPYTMELEKKLAQFTSDATPCTPRKLEYRIGKLFIKELSGTLNIGITSIDTDTHLSELSTLTTEDLSDDSPSVQEESWYREEGWFGDPPSIR